MNDFLKTIEDMDASDYKDEATHFPNLHKVDKIDGSFKELLSACKKVKEEEIEGFIKNSNKIKENKGGFRSIDQLHGELPNQQLLDDEEDFI